MSERGDGAVDRIAALDPNVSQRLASDPAASVWVGASAGSGKTKVLTDRVLRQMLAGTPPARILCLTFTKAAAAEMAIRINRTLGAWATVDDARLEDELTALTGERPTAETRRDARRLFARVIDCPGGMKLQTIHAFCQSLLRRFPLEAGLAAHFEVMDEATATELLLRARGAVLSQARCEPEAPVGRALTRLAAELHEGALGALMVDLACERGRLRRILTDHGGLEGTIEAVCRVLDVAPGTDDRSVTLAACTDRAFDGPGLRRACRALAGGSASDQERAIGVAAWLAGSLEERGRGFMPYARLFLTLDDTPRKILITKKAAAGDTAVPEILLTEAERLVTLLGRRKAAGVAASTAALLTFAEALLEAYCRLKDARALLDYDDLILAARDLLACEGVAPWVLFKLDGGLDHILIDEAQDTNPEQWAVVARLAEEFFAGLGARADTEAPARTVFAVGDEKQSIFSFQRADPREFARLRQHFKERVEGAHQVWRQVALDISFRSTAAVLRLVDGVFARTEARDGVTLDSAATIRHFAHRRGQGGLVELWPAIAPEPSEPGQPWLVPLVREAATEPSARLAAAIADTIRGWLERGERLEAKGRPIRPGDIMVLVRRRTGFVPTLVRALKDRGVAVAGVDRMILSQQLSVMDLTALAGFVLLCDDDLTLAVVLKGPFIGFDEDALYTLANPRSGTLWRALAERAEVEPGSAYARAYAWLDRLLARADFDPLYEFFAGILHQPCPADPDSGLRAILGRLGAEARDPLDEFLSLCLTYQRMHPPSLQGFLHWLAANEAEIKREQEQAGGPAGGMVRIMTVHGAKGLQAPIVFLPDTTRKPTQSVRVLWPEGARSIPLYAPRRAQEEDRCAEARALADRLRDQEYRRLLYVALTRAEDRLYVCGWLGQHKAQSDSWYGLIDEALAADPDSREFEFTSPNPRDARGPSGTGRRLFEPQTAPLKADAAEGPPPPSPPLPPWANLRPKIEPQPSRPLTPSAPDGIEPTIRSPLGSDDGSGFRRGLLLHRLFQSLPDLEPAIRRTAALRFLARPAHSLTPGTREAMVAEVLAVLEDPTFAALFGPGSRAEVPVVGQVGNRVLSARIDRLLVTPQEVWIIDYKTNRPAPATLAQVAPLYLQQMASYRAALQAIYPGHSVRCVMLWTDAPRLMEIPAAPLVQNTGPS